MTNEWARSRFAFRLTGIGQGVHVAVGALCRVVHRHVGLYIALLVATGAQIARLGDAQGGRVHIMARLASDVRFAVPAFLPLVESGSVACAAKLG